MQPKHRKAMYPPFRRAYKPTGYANPFFKPAKPQKSKRFYYGLALLGISCAAWVYFLFFSNVFKITDWEIYGLETYAKNDIQDNLKSFLGNSKLFIFKFSNIFIFNPDNFKKYLAENFAFQDIKIKKYYPHKIIISMQEKTGREAIYNKNKIYIVSDDGTVIMEKGGVENWLEISQANQEQIISSSTADAYKIDIEKIITDAKTKGFSDYLIFYDAYSDEIPAVGKTYPAHNTLKVINEFINALYEKTSIKVRLIALIKNYLNPKIIIFTENNWKIYLNAADDGQRQFYKLYAVFQEQIKDINKPLEYIDLRFEDRVYIK